ncbi:hypothetical protein J5Y09_16300 [Roseomonas sp. PWR1]|uniref:Uncharacterized protein n=1 Tax=Roseomonas nitratireducens TaxID=2820810 RepID=A0ABS4AVU7_9PROT|nr:hypothetical protein [Neoroseomonas nitratireducens]MBP0465488.1 hypothetical protein [Neoroseomonas nitratireducens]
MDIATPRRRIVHDMLFGIDGSGWHPPELRDGIGFRRSGPGRLSILRVALPAGAGRGEAQLLLLADEAIPAPALFLNGHALDTASRRVGPGAVLDFTWGEDAMPEPGLAEFWFLADRMEHVPASGGGMRSMGFRLCALGLETAEAGPTTAPDAVARIAGERFLREILPVAPGRLRLAFRETEGARVVEAVTEGARLGPTPVPGLAIGLRADGNALHVRLGAPGGALLAATLRGAGPLVLPGALAPRDALLMARFLAALPSAYGAWLDTAMRGAAPDAALLGAWRRDVARLARAAECALAVALADGPSVFGADPAAPFAWPVVG